MKIRQRRPARAHLAVEHLEDRTTPASFDVGVPGLEATAVIPDRVNVVMANHTTTATDQAALAATPYATAVDALGFGIYRVTLTPGYSSELASTYYSSLPGVTAAEPDLVIQVDRTPNDPSYGSLYGMTRIGAPAAWDIATGNSSFVVAVIDTGVDYNHPDLAANLWHNPAETPGDGIDNDGNGIIDDYYGANFVNNTGNPFDDNGHGSHVSGTIGAVGNNALGVAGVNWNVKIMALKFLNASGSGSTSGAIAALNYAVAHGVKVSNNSWGGGGFSTALSNAISNARSAGHIFVAAAGNNGSNNDTTANYPSNYNFDNVVAVAATDSADGRASFSNYGASTVDLGAPGVGILSTTPNNTYSSYSGTSMATPHVTGAIALYWGANPTQTYTQVINRLYSTVDVIPSMTGVTTTGGRLNVGRMLAGTTPPPPPADTTGPRVTTSAYNGTTSFSAVRLTFNEAILASSFTAADVASFTGPGGAIAVSGVNVVAGTGNTQFDVTFTTQTAAGTYSLVIGPDIRDTAGNLMDQNQNGTKGEVPGDQFTAATSIAASGTFTFAAAGLPLPIRDFQTTTSTITVNQDITISDLNVRLSLTHTWDSDLRVRLTRAGSTVVTTLSNRRGGSGDNYSNTLFDDEAGTAIASGVAPFAGSFRPETGSPLSAYDNQNARGTWTLTVEDLAGADIGNLTAWSLIVTGSPGGAMVHSLGFRDGPVMSGDTPAVAAVTAPVERAPAAVAAIAAATQSWAVPVIDPVVLGLAPVSDELVAEVAAPPSARPAAVWFLMPDDEDDAIGVHHAGDVTGGASAVAASVPAEDAWDVAGLAVG